ncbi:MAG: TraR/DksA C4-type zinc finger protein [Nitrospirae bacterium]|nr:TraR/DksA C4-type zinc finger protein [Nitrospirota bacterium]
MTEGTTARNFDEIRDLLDRQRKSILAMSEEIIANGAMGTDGTNFPDMSDQATAEQDQSLNIRMRGREQKLLIKIEEALERITAGTYGICESCEEEIAYERLKARPVTTLCIDCKTEQEAQEAMSPE